MASICSAQKRGYNAHDAAAFGARGRADVCLRRRSLVSRGPGALDPFEKSGPTQGELCGATAIGHEAEVADAVETVWQSVQEKATDELVGRELHDLAGAVLAIILPGESDVIIFDGGQAAVGDGDAVRIATEIGERLGGSAERLLLHRRPSRCPACPRRGRRSSRDWRDREGRRGSSGRRRRRFFADVRGTDGGRVLRAA